MEFKIPSSSARRNKSEHINTNQAKVFDVPPRDPGRIPALPYREGHIQKNNLAKMAGKIVKDQSRVVGQGFPPIPSNPTLGLPTIFGPTKNLREEKVPNLSDLI